MCAVSPHTFKMRFINNFRSMEREITMKEKRTSEFIGAFIGGILSLVIVNSFPLWRPLTHGIVLETWVYILWAANMSIIVQMGGNLFLAIYRPARLYSLIQAMIAIAGLVSVIVFYQVFPLDFSQIAAGWLNILTKAALIVGMAGTVLGTIIYLFRAVIGTQYTPVKKRK